MKRLIVLCILVLSVLCLYSQDVFFPPSIISAGGSNPGNKVKQVSKWRIGYVHVIQVSSNSSKSYDAQSSFTNSIQPIEIWDITAFPNPVHDILYIQFDINRTESFNVTVSDVTGRKVLIKERQIIAPNQTVELDLSNLISALYIINIQSSESSLFKILKVTKN